MKPTINYSDFEKLDLRVGKIMKVEEIEGADKLYKITINAGKELGERTICAGIKSHYSKKDLLKKKIVFVANLAPRMLRGVESQGMILAAGDEKEVFVISPEKDIEEGINRVIQWTEKNCK